MSMPRRTRCCKLPLWTAKMRGFVTFCSSTFPALILATSLGLPKLIVPNFPDLMIKTRLTSGDGLWQVNTTLYLKGARQRTESVMEQARADATNAVTIQQCDERRRFI